MEVQLHTNFTSVLGRNQLSASLSGTYSQFPAALNINMGGKNKNNLKNLTIRNIL